MYPQVMLHAVIIHAFTVFEQTLILLNHKEFETTIIDLMIDTELQKLCICNNTSAFEWVYNVLINRLVLWCFFPWFEGYVL